MPNARVAGSRQHMRVSIFKVATVRVYMAELFRSFFV